MNGFVGTFVNHLDGNVTFSTSEKKFGVSALHFPRNAGVRTNAFASELGIGGNSPRTISFWMKALDNGKSNHNNWETGVYGIGQRRDFKMWAIRSLWNTANYRYFRTQHWGWVQNVFVSEGVRDKWMHIAHLYDSKNVMVYVNGTRRANLSKDDLNTGDTFPLLFGQWTDENRKDRTFHGYLDDFRVYNASISVKFKESTMMEMEILRLSLYLIWIQWLKPVLQLAMLSFTETVSLLKLKILVQMI